MLFIGEPPAPESLLFKKLSCFVLLRLFLQPDGHVFSIRDASSLCKVYLLPLTFFSFFSASHPIENILMATSLLMAYMKACFAVEPTASWTYEWIPRRLF